MAARETICKQCHTLVDVPSGFLARGLGKIVMYLATGILALLIFPLLLIVVIGVALAIEVMGRKGSGARCPECGSDELIPTDTPMGRKLVAQLDDGDDGN